MTTATRTSGVAPLAVFFDAIDSVAPAWSSGVIQPADGDYASASVRLGDLNGDGVLDIVSAEYYAAAAGVFMGRGDGTFSDLRAFSTGAPLRLMVSRWEI